MSSDKTGKGGFLLAGLILLAILAAGLYVPFIQPADTSIIMDDLESFPPLHPSDNPGVIEEQLKMRDIGRIANRMKDDISGIFDLYDQLPKFQPPENDRITRDDFEKFITTFDAYSYRMKKFRQKAAGGTPGAFRTIALVGIWGQFAQKSKMEALIENNITQEQFDWLQSRIFAAGLFCVEYKLAHDPMETEEKDQLNRIREQMYLLTNVKVMDDGGGITDYRNQKLESLLNSTPQQNISIFLDVYPRLRHSNIKFIYPVNILFDREAIMQAAANNPP